MLEPDVPDERVVDHHRQVARHLQLVAAAHRDAVDARERRLAELAEPVVRILERAEPFPVFTRIAEVVLRPRFQIGAHAERAPRAGEDDDANLVVPRRVLGGAGQLAQQPEVERVQHLGTVEGDRRARRRLLVHDRLEAELLRRARSRMRRLSQRSRTSR